MENIQLDQYIKQAKEKGLTNEQISAELFSAGWPEEIVRQKLFNVGTPEGKTGTSISEKIKLVFGFIFFFVEIFFFWKYVEYSDPFQRPEVWIMFAIMSVVMFFISIISTTNSLSLKKAYPVLGKLFFVLSILSLPFIYQGIGTLISKVYWREEIKQKAIRVKEFDKEFYNEQEKNANEELGNCFKVQKFFETPVKVVGYQHATSLVLDYFDLDNGYKVSLYGVERDKVLDYLPEYQKNLDFQRKEFIESELVGRTLDVKLPDCKKEYSQSMYTDVISGKKNYLEVLIFTSDGSLLNLKYPEFVNTFLGENLKDKLILELNDYQNRKPFFNK